MAVKDHMCPSPAHGSSAELPQTKSQHAFKVMEVMVQVCPHGQRAQNNHTAMIRLRLLLPWLLMRRRRRLMARICLGLWGAQQSIALMVETCGQRARPAHIQHTFPHVLWRPENTPQPSMAVSCCVWERNTSIACGRGRLLRQPLRLRPPPPALRWVQLPTGLSVAAS